MKLRYIIPTLLAAVAVLFGCSEDDEKTYLDGLRVSQSLVALDTLGTPVQVTINSSADWAFAKVITEEITKEDGTKEKVSVETPAWLTVDKLSGGAGETVITFSAAKATESNSAELQIVSGGQTLRLTVIQVTKKTELPISTCADVIAGPDSKTYRVKGAVKNIANTTYGNWYLQDETGEIYIYGTLDAKGNTKNFLSLGLEVGDIVTVEGPKTTYNGTVELVDVTVVDIEKSLIKVDSVEYAGDDATALPVEGGEMTAFLTNKGGSYTVEIPAEAQGWLFIKSFTDNSLTLVALPNAGGDRSATVTVKTTANGKSYTSTFDVAQKGAIIGATVAEFLAAEVGDTQYRVTGIITSVANPTYGNVYIRDYSGEVYVYGIGAKGDFEAAGLKAGDVVTLLGKRAVYKESPQMTGGVCESFIAVTEVTIDEFLAKEDNPNIYYKVTGVVDEIANESYGNLYLKSGDTRLYVYGTYPGWGATGDNRKNCLADRDIAVGDELTVIGVKSTYKDVPQVNGGIYFSHAKPAAEE